ncbi:hypothetical protein [Streptomyces hainanensis]|uniref:Uncharacterized protein n=1 Tax=Streptomyces hainanensis TaxID=402648 RepID=A0A4R4TKW4_9ACTN|nr:hypothetical protein [Streptomyces hainanensis]TDC78370.1 hypothetical protein E1283_05220 [Streptomyces hainanensis]
MLIAAPAASADPIAACNVFLVNDELGGYLYTECGAGIPLRVRGRVTCETVDGDRYEITGEWRRIDESEGAVFRTYCDPGDTAVGGRADLR